jgi:two-component system response regulator PilR (NtrC family)
VTRILVVDDERSMREFLQILLEAEGYDCCVAADVQEAITLARQESPELVFSDLKLPGGSGMDVLRWLRENLPETQVIMMTAFGSTENAVEAMRLGAYDYQVKPVKVDEIRALTQKALEKVTLLRDNRELSAALQNRFGLTQIIGKSGRMTEVVALIERVATSRTNVLVEGESGTGKELVARRIHEGSPRARGPFVAVNCGAIPETLIEAELFGHVAGAFTGAQRARRGLFEAANSGTLLLDEISELPHHMQVKLLRVLQERSIRRVGDERERSVDVRIVAATNKDLQDEVKKNRFREDLFYRLNVVRIRVPPLRERVEDIPLLAKFFVRTYANESGKPINGIADDAMRTLCSFRFPGNVRELENYIERAVALCRSEQIEVDDLPAEIRERPTNASDDLLAFPETGVALESVLQEIEKRFIAAALDRADGVKTRAAELLGLSFRSFRYRLQKLGMPVGDEPDDRKDTGPLGD